MRLSFILNNHLSGGLRESILPTAMPFRHIVFPVIHTRSHMSEMPLIDFALTRNHLVTANRAVILLTFIRIECVNAVMIRCQSIFQSDPSSQNNLFAHFLAFRISLEAVLEKAHIQNLNRRILNSAAAILPELFEFRLMGKIQISEGPDRLRAEYL